MIDPVTQFRDVGHGLFETISHSRTHHLAEVFVPALPLWSKRISETLPRRFPQPNILLIILAIPRNLAAAVQLPIPWIVVRR